jgi:hypothetical protein
MTSWKRVALIGTGAVIAFDAVASLASRAVGFQYGWATVGSWIIYAICGYFAAHVVSQGQLKVAASTGVLLGSVDATLGWYVSWLIGPGRVVGGLTPILWTSAAVVVIATSTALATLGGILCRRRMH